MNEAEHNIVTISFIIPAFNEQNHLRNTILAIKSNPPNYPYQIIVVDNGSTDGTAEIAQSERTLLIKHPKNTIASARNRGASISQGEILVFLDADVLVTPTWSERIDGVIVEILDNPMLITGSRCSVSDEKNWFSRYWFSRMSHETANYINSGHLITSRKLFDSIEGFTEELHTAEDYDFCMRAKEVGTKVVNNPQLYVIHTGYPTTLKGFIERERWHGCQDFKNLYAIIKSKVALVAILNVVLMIGFLITALLKGNMSYVLLYFILMYIFSGISTVSKFGIGSIILLLNTSTIFFFYFLGRSLSFWDSIKKLLRLR